MSTDLGPTAPLVEPVDVRAARRRRRQHVVLALVGAPLAVGVVCALVGYFGASEFGLLLLASGIAALRVGLAGVLEARGRPARLATSVADPDVAAATTAGIDEFELRVLHPGIDLPRRALERRWYGGVLEVRAATYRLVFDSKQRPAPDLDVVEWPRAVADFRLLRRDLLGGATVRIGQGDRAIDVALGAGAESDRLIASLDSSVRPDVGAVAPFVRSVALLVAGAVGVVGGLALWLTGPSAFDSSSPSATSSSSSAWRTLHPQPAPPPQPQAHAGQPEVPSGVWLDTSEGREIDYGHAWAGSSCPTLRLRVVGFPAAAVREAKTVVAQARRGGVPLRLVVGGHDPVSEPGGGHAPVIAWTGGGGNGIDSNAYLRTTPRPDDTYALTSWRQTTFAVLDLPNGHRHLRQALRNEVARSIGVVGVTEPSGMSGGVDLDRFTERDLTVLRGALGCG